MQNQNIGADIVLSGDDIQQRLENTDDPEIFKPDTWVGTGLKEASYALRVANNQLMMTAYSTSKTTHSLEPTSKSARAE